MTLPPQHFYRDQPIADPNGEAFRRRLRRGPHNCPVPVREGPAPTCAPRLSVVVPFYNVEAYAATTLISLARSRHPDIEFVLVDDASTDATPAVLSDHADSLGRVSVLTHSRNAGLSGARNTGLDAAAGTYVAFLDGDDWVEPGY